MSNIVNYKGTDYLQIGGRWVNARTFIAPPKIILRELDLLISNENDNHKEIKLPVEALLLVVNGRLCQPTTILYHGEELNLIPALSGG